MNVLILINSAPNYKFFYYKLGLALEKKGASVFYAIDSERSANIEPLVKIDNSGKTIFFNRFFEENYNKEFPELYNCSWGDFFYSDFDRFLTHEFNLKKNKNYWIKARLCLDNFFHLFMKENKIDFVLYENISNSFAYSAWKVASNNNIKYIGLMGSRIPNRFEMQTSIIDNEIQLISELLVHPVSAEENAWFQEYKSNIVETQPDYMSQNGLDNVSISRLFNFSKFKKFINLLKSDYMFNHYYDYQFGSAKENLIKAIRVNFIRFYNNKISSNYYLKDDELSHSLLNDKFYIYPIHYHPESSTSVLAPEYTNEYNNILNIANNLPFGTYLYVKDHISAKGVNPPKFYEKISSLPNVKIIHWKFNVKKLIKSSIGVITVNSTVGYESLLLEKPVFILGRVFYEKFPNVFMLNGFKDIREIRDVFFDSAENENIKKYFIAYLRYTFPGSIKINSVNDLEDTYFSDIARLILKKVGIHDY
ncbi:capsular polysaccharide export protein, LipB/KpsS family [Pectobacterium polaris]|uniref:capsular polysaccharide export protein, LipB/KpsS family n=1 Tax=Pectobacterium polaris TaxID=2042057 RepID=UPI001581B6E8|nr:capsular biosynthesis protein [Pectobacterium polaris]